MNEGIQIGVLPYFLCSFAKRFTVFVLPRLNFGKCKEGTFFSNIMARLRCYTKLNNWATAKNVEKKCKREGSQFVTQPRPYSVFFVVCITINLYNEFPGMVFYNAKMFLMFQLSKL